MRVLGRLVAIQLLVVRASLAIPPADEKWIRVQSPHFTIFSNAHRDDAIEVAIEAERFRAFMEMDQQAYGPSLPTIVFLFKDDASFAPYKKTPEGGVRSYVGVFSDSRSGPCIAMRADLEESFRTVYHEYTHFVLSRKSYQVPLWLHEGMAEYLSTFRGRGRKVQIGRPVQNHVALLRTHELMPLGDLFAMDVDSKDYNEGVRQGIFYAQSWALYHYLRHERTAVFARLGALIDAVYGGANVLEAFHGVCGVDYRTIDVGLKGSIESTEFEYYEVTLPESQMDPAVRVDEVPRSELLNRLGAYLGEVTPWESLAGEAHLQAALGLDPGHARAHAALAGVVGRQGRWAEAKQHYERALELGRDDELPWFLYGMAEVDRYRQEHTQIPALPDSLPGGLLRARGLLGRAIELNPERGEAWAALGWTYLFEPGDVSTGIQLLQRASSLLPARMDLVYDLVLLCLRQGDRETAVGLTDEVLVHGDRQWLEQARAALQNQAANEQIDQYNQAVEAFNSQEYGSAVTLLEALVPGVQDPDLRQQVLRLTEETRARLVELQQVDLYNQAVGKARAGDRQGAVVILEALVQQARDPDLARSARDLLAQLRPESAPRPVPKPK